MSDTIKEADKPKKRSIWVYLAVVLLGLCALVFVGTAALFFALFSGTDRNLDDFESQAEARDFVSGHLPVAVGSSTSVTRLNYEKFTDWILRSELEFASESERDSFLNDLRKARKIDEQYCGPEQQDAVGYFLAEYHACGSVAPGPTARSVTVTCNTR